MEEKVIIITGGAKGTDTLGALYAIERGYEHIVMKADREIYGESEEIVTERDYEQMERKL